MDQLRLSNRDFQLRCLFFSRREHRFIAISPIPWQIPWNCAFADSFSSSFSSLFPRDNQKIVIRKIKKNFSFQSRDFFPKFRTAVYDRHDIVTVLCISLSLFHSRSHSLASSFSLALPYYSSSTHYAKTSLFQHRTLLPEL